MMSDKQVKSCSGRDHIDLLTESAGRAESGVEFPPCKLIDVGNAKRWPKSLATLALLTIVRRVPPGAVRCRSLRSRHRPSPGLRRSLRSLNSFAKKKQAFSMAQELRKPGARCPTYHVRPAIRADQILL